MTPDFTADVCLLPFIFFLPHLAFADIRGTPIVDKSFAIAFPCIDDGFYPFVYIISGIVLSLIVLSMIFFTFHLNFFGLLTHVNMCNKSLYLE